MESKTGDEKFGHALHDDLTLSAICKKIKQKESEGNRRIHMSRRAWKYRIKTDESEKEAFMQRCAYASRRTQLACKNYRPASKLTPQGFCEVHASFFRQLGQQAAAEQRRIERTLLNKSADFSVDFDDETLLTVNGWPVVQHEPLNDLLLDDDDEDSLKNAGVWTDEEVLRSRLISLERKLFIIRNFRKLVKEKASCLTTAHAKRLERQKSGKIDAENECVSKVQCAKQKYHTTYSKKEQYMMRRLKARLEWNGTEERKFNYLNIDNTKGSQCIYMIQEDSDTVCNDQLNSVKKCKINKDSEVIKEINEKNVEDIQVIIYSVVDSLCKKVALILDQRNDLSIVESDTAGEQLNGHRCSNLTLPKSAYCTKHIYEDIHQCLFTSCIECGSAALDFADGQNFCFRHIDKRKGAPLGLWKTTTLQHGVVSVSDAAGKLLVEQQPNASESDDLQFAAVSVPSPIGVTESVTESNEPPVKFVVIDEEGDEGDVIELKQTTSSSTGTMRNVAQYGIPVHPKQKLWQDEDVYSCARTRPFTAEHIHKAKLRRGIGMGSRFSNVRDYLGGDLLSSSLYRSQEELSKSVVRELLNGGPTKAAASASHLAFAGNRRISAAAIGFAPKTGIRRTVYGTSPSKARVDTPEMISLGSTGSAVGSSISTGSRSPRPVMQKPIVLRSRTGLPSGHHPLSSQSAVNAARYVATVGTSRPLQNWRNRTAISLDSRIRRTPVNSILPMDYSARSLNAPPPPALPSAGPFLRRREERQFVTGSARSRLVAVDHASCNTPRLYSNPSCPSAYRQGMARTVVYRSRVEAEPKLPPSADTLETAAAVASIAADLETPADRELDETDSDLTMSHATASWETPDSGNLESEHHSNIESVVKICKSGFDCNLGGTKMGQSSIAVSRQSSGENAEDGLAVLAMAAASRAADSDQSPTKKCKYGQLGLEDEDDE